MTRFILAVVAYLLAAGAQAAEFKVGSLDIKSPWARATASALVPGGLYMTIENGGDVSDRLISVVCYGAKVAEVHETKVENGVMRMNFIETVEVPAGGRVEFAPGGQHVMLAGMTSALTEGNTLECLIYFQRAGATKIVAQILGAGAVEPVAARLGN